MSATFDDFIRPLPHVATGDAALDALFAKLEAGHAETAAILAHARGRDALLARLQQVTDSVGAIDEAPSAERSVYETVWAAQSPRASSIAVLAEACVSGAVAPAVEEAMLRIFETHPWSVVRLRVGAALANAPSTSHAALERLAPAMNDPQPNAVWVRDVGTTAAVRLDPATAYDRLHARIEEELQGTHSYLARGLFQALIKHGTPVDARWFPLLVRFFDHGESGSADGFFSSQPVPAAFEAVIAYLRDRLEQQKPWLAPLGFMLQRVEKLAAPVAPALVPWVAAALDAGAADWRVTGPLDALIAIDDDSVVPALRALLPKAKRKRRPPSTRRSRSSRAIFRRATRRARRNRSMIRSQRCSTASATIASARSLPSQSRASCSSQRKPKRTRKWGRHASAVTPIFLRASRGRLCA